MKKDTILNVEKPALLMEFLIQNLPRITRKEVKMLLEHNAVIVDGVIRTKYNYPLHKGQRIVLDYNNRYMFLKNNNIKILYEDRDFIAIDKPAGLLTVATEDKTLKTVFTVMNQYVKLADKNNRIYIVHRLDRETSGVMLIALNEEFKNKLQDNWNEIAISRKYLTLTEGVFQKEEGVITQYLKQNKNFSMYNSREIDGGKAVTEYKVIKANDEFSLLDVSIKSGKKNQIRVAMQSLGHSVVGDRKYGSKINPIKRMGLHSYLLEIKNPKNGEVMSFKSEIPKEFNKIFKGDVK